MWGRSYLLWGLSYLRMPQRIPTRIWRKGDQMFCTQDLLWCPPYVGVNLRDPGSIATSRARTIRACSLRLIEGFEGYPDPLGFYPWLSLLEAPSEASVQCQGSSLPLVTVPHPAHTSAHPLQTWCPALPGTILLSPGIWPLPLTVED